MQPVAGYSLNMRNFIQDFVVLLCLVNESVLSISYTNVIQLPQGKVQGSQTLQGHRKFLGIPYATLVERFQDPGDAPTWDGTLHATNGAISCNQYIPRLKIPIGQEDCLVLNVYTPPQSNNNNHFPVMVFIHGGGYYWGSSSSLIYDPGPLIEKGVIVVTINYRLGAFGFLCLRIKGASGNAGLKDQVAALEWVNKNIKYFNGDSQSVTVFGQSAGSASVNYLMLSPLSRGLFHRAIMESGTALSPFAFSSDPISKAATVANNLGYKTKNPYELLKIFQNATANEIEMASVPRDSMNLLARYTFRPCAERSGMDSRSFITKSPKEMLESGNYYKVPTIIGYNDKEGIYYVSQYNRQSLREVYKNFEEVLPDNLYFRNITEQQIVVNEIKQFYFRGKYQNNNMTDSFIDYFSDIMFHYPAVATIDYLLQNKIYPVFNYFFKYDSYRNLGKFVSGMKHLKGASHSDELFYLFQPLVLWPLPKVEKDVAVIDKMTTLWTNFAKTGSSSYKSTKDWPNSESGNLKYIILDQNTWISPIPNRRRIELWKSIYSKYGNY